jgi:copper chaperone CopZ
VSLRTGEAIVTYETGDVTIEQMVGVVNRLGFRASPKEAGRPEKLKPE